MTHPHDLADDNLLDVLPTDGSSRLSSWRALRFMPQKFRRGIIRAVLNGADVTMSDGELPEGA